MVPVDMRYCLGEQDLEVTSFETAKEGQLESSDEVKNSVLRTSFTLAL